MKLLAAAIASLSDDEADFVAEGLSRSWDHVAAEVAAAPLGRIVRALVIELRADAARKRRAFAELAADATDDGEAGALVEDFDVPEGWTET